MALMMYRLLVMLLCIFCITHSDKGYGGLKRTGSYLERLYYPVRPRSTWNLTIRIVVIIEVLTVEQLSLSTVTQV